MQSKIDRLKSEYKIAIGKYSKELMEYIKVHGEDKSDYLIHLSETVEYYRGKYNAMIELEEM